MNVSRQRINSYDAKVGDRSAVEVLDRLTRVFGEAEWKPSGRPVDEIVATILSQNTSDTNTERAFNSLRQRFPDWRDVVSASTSDVADSIRLGGLADQKAPRIQHVLASILSDDTGDPNQDFLETLSTLDLHQAMDRLVALPGVGPKTAACVLLFAVGLPALPVDTHVHRVAQRVGLIPARMDANRAHEELRRQIPPNRAYQFHVHLIKHGRQTCRARNPRCDECVLSDICQYRLTLVESM